jgi:hypothetical protein
MTDSNLKYPWQQPVLDALMELRQEYLPAKVNTAERAISARLCQPDAADIEERLALRDALQSLRVLFPHKCEPQLGEKKEIA